MSDYKYTIYANHEKIVSLDDIEIARDAIYEIGGDAYIQYNESGIKEYELGASPA